MGIYFVSPHAKGSALFPAALYLYPIDMMWYWLLIIPASSLHARSQLGSRDAASPKMMLVFKFLV